VPTHFLATTGTRVGQSVTLVDQGVRVPVRIVGEDFDPGNAGLVINADLDTLTGVQPTLHPDFYDVMLKPGTSATDYVAALSHALGAGGAQAMANQAPRLNATVIAFDSMAVLLTLILLSVAGLGVLNSVVLDTRERVHDLGVCKAVGMTPGQTITQVLTSVAGSGALAGLVGVPAGVALHDYVIPLVLRAAGSGTPAQVQNVYGLTELVLLGLGGLLIASCGALLPASWAARARTATALRTE
jgi:putative ABC transport system permease protein